MRYKWACRMAGVLEKQLASWLSRIRRGNVIIIKRDLLPSGNIALKGFSAHLAQRKGWRQCLNFLSIYSMDLPACCY